MVLYGLDCHKGGVYKETVLRSSGSHYNLLSGFQVFNFDLFKTGDKLVFSRLDKTGQHQIKMGMEYHIRNRL